MLNLLMIKLKILIKQTEFYVLLMLIFLLNAFIINDTIGTEVYANNLGYRYEMNIIYNCYKNNFRLAAIIVMIFSLCYVTLRNAKLENNYNKSLKVKYTKEKIFLSNYLFHSIFTMIVVMAFYMINMAVAYLIIPTERFYDVSFYYDFYDKFYLSTYIFDNAYLIYTLYSFLITIVISIYVSLSHSLNKLMNYRFAIASTFGVFTLLELILTFYGFKKYTIMNLFVNYNIKITSIIDFLPAMILPLLLSIILIIYSNYKKIKG